MSSILMQKDFETLRLIKHISEESKNSDVNLDSIIEEEVFRNIGRFAVDI